MKKTILFISSLIFLFSCNGKHKVFEKFEKFDNYDWTLNKVISFDVVIDDTSASYDVYLPVRHTDNYPYDGFLLILPIPRQMEKSMLKITNLISVIKMGNL